MDKILIDCSELNGQAGIQAIDNILMTFHDIKLLRNEGNYKWRTWIRHICIEGKSLHKRDKIYRVRIVEEILLEFFQFGRYMPDIQGLHS